MDHQVRVFDGFYAEDAFYLQCAQLGPYPLVRWLQLQGRTTHRTVTFLIISSGKVVLNATSAIRRVALDAVLRIYQQSLANWAY